MYIKTFLALKIRKSVPKLAFAFSKSDFLGLVNFDFLDLVKFLIVDRFSILPSILPPTPPPPTLPPPTPPALVEAPWFFSSSVT